MVYPGEGGRFDSQLECFLVSGRMFQVVFYLWPSLFIQDVCSLFCPFGLVW